MTELQKILLSLYKEFKKICEENDLRYFANGGTKLGAVRHKGFIPWDDDMDVSMPLGDYRKFISLVTKMNSKEFGVLSSFDQDKESSYSVVSKFYDKNSLFIEDVNRIDDPNTFHGVFIDVFPIFVVPSNKRQRRAYFARLRKFQYNLIFRNIYHQDDIKKEELVNDYKKFISYGESHASGSEYAFEPGPPKQIEDMEKTAYPLSTYDGYTELPFEDTTIRVPVDYDRQLTSQYGDWRKLPPKVEQINKHADGGAYDLNRPYSEYRDKIANPLVKPLVGQLVRYAGQLHRNLENTEARRIGEKSYYESELERLRSELEEVKKERDQLKHPGIKQSAKQLGRSLRTRFGNETRK